MARWRAGAEQPGLRPAGRSQLQFWRGSPQARRGCTHQQINHRFWSQLDTEPLNPEVRPRPPQRGPGARPPAWPFTKRRAPGGAWLWPRLANLQHEQLSLLLGIAQQCPFRHRRPGGPRSGGRRKPGHRQYNWHVELQLNQALVTGMRFEDGVLRRDAAMPIPGSGWLAFMDSLYRAIADAFIRQTRYDPRRSRPPRTGAVRPFAGTA